MNNNDLRMQYKFATADDVYDIVDEVSTKKANYILWLEDKVILQRQIITEKNHTLKEANDIILNNMRNE